MDDLSAKACVLATSLSESLIGVDPAVAVSALLILTKTLYEDHTKERLTGADVLFFIEDLDVQITRARRTFADVNRLV